MNEIGHFKVLILYSGDVDHLHVKRIHLVCFSYIVIEDRVNLSVDTLPSTHIVCSFLVAMTIQ
jgi:hypothetical protein